MGIYNKKKNKYTKPRVKEQKITLNYFFRGSGFGDVEGDLLAVCFLKSCGCGKPCGGQ